MSASNNAAERRRSAELSDIVDRFEAAWRKDNPPVIDDYLPAEGAHRQAVLVELVHVELDRRLRRGQPARVEQYLKKYPELAHDRTVVFDLIFAEYRMRRSRECIAD